MQIADNCVVSFDYTLTNGTGEVLDSSEGSQPLHYLHGHGNIIPGLEAALMGRSPGDAFDITIPPADAYGERRDGLMRSVPRAQFQGVSDIQVGMQFRANTATGPVVFTVVNVETETVELDGNHPLAGETLHFAVTVREVRQATQEEIDHGHVHGPGGHHHH